MPEVKCKRCRKNLFDQTIAVFLNAHGDVKLNPAHVGCKIDAQECCLYMSVERVPEWIQNSINQESWTKGKLNCPHCDSRLGSFNLINDIKCHCGEFVTPPIRIVCSKVDILFDCCDNIGNNAIS